jgi:hypothetical protein
VLAYGQNILQDALEGAVLALQDAEGPRRLVIERQIRVLRNIAAHYDLVLEQFPNAPANPVENRGNDVPIPDQEIGFLGEQAIFNRELESVRRLGLEPAAVEWVSQAVPQAPYDIKTIRRHGVEDQDHYLEVKSSGAEDGPNIYISSGQLDFLAAHKLSSSVVIVRFNAQGEVTNIQDLSFAELCKQFELIPIKYKLACRE